jgi:aspartate carbamoyltransferase catalytic subunit
MKDLISINDLTKEQIIDILDKADEFKRGEANCNLNGKVVASCFFEASTRTRLSFEAAVNYLGGRVIGFSESSNTSLGAKGESLVDTLRVIDGYADCLIIRHPLDGSARLAAEICQNPVINAGDGANQHPTQTLLDLFSIRATQGRLDQVNVAIMGDLKYSRTVHSLLHAARFFDLKLYFIAPQGLRMDDEQLFALKQLGIQYSFHNYVEEVISHIDCLYLTRPQKERFNGVSHEAYAINLATLKNARENLRILHPLPRQQELPPEIDDTPYAYYFEQAKNGLYVRQAILASIL